jgi:hypothetical protein
MRFFGRKWQKKDKQKADPPFDFAQGRLSGDDHKKGNGEEKTMAINRSSRPLKLVAG